MALLNDVPAWLRSLRLHKYTPNFERANWKEMIMLDDAGLDAKGVNALGARRKLLKSVSSYRIVARERLLIDSQGIRDRASSDGDGAAGRCNGIFSQLAYPQRERGCLRCCAGFDFLCIIFRSLMVD